MPQAATLTSTSPRAGAGSGRSAISRCLYSERRRAFMNAADPFLEGNSAFPGNKIILGEELRFCASVSAGDLDHAFKNCFAHFFDTGLAGDDAARVNIDDVGHALSKTRVGRDFQNGGNGITRWRAQPRCE